VAVTSFLVEVFLYCPDLGAIVPGGNPLVLLPMTSSNLRLKDEVCYTRAIPSGQVYCPMNEKDQDLHHCAGCSYCRGPSITDGYGTAPKIAIFCAYSSAEPDRR